MKRNKIVLFNNIMNIHVISRKGKFVIETMVRKKGLGEWRGGDTRDTIFFLIPKNKANYLLLIY